MKKIIAITIGCVLFFVTQGYSQKGGSLSIQYAMGFSSGDMGEFISAPSFRGALVEYRAPINDNLFVGIDAGWNVFYEKKDYDTYTSGTISLSGIQYRYQNEVPLLVAADYLFISDKAFKPYAGLGIGTMYTERSTDMNLYRLEENIWHFAVKPELGLMYELSYGTSLKLAAKYYYGVKTASMESQGYFSVSVGFAFKFQ